MAQQRPGAPPPVPPRIDLGETEENVLDSQEHVPATELPLKDSNGSETPKPQTIVPAKETEPVVTPKPSSSASQNAAAKQITSPVGIANKTVQNDETKSRPEISIISAFPMDQAGSFPTVHFTKDKADLATQENNVNNNGSGQQTVEGTPVLDKPSKPAPPAPRKAPPKPDDKNPKPVDTSRKMTPIPGIRSKTKNPKKDSGSIFYIDATTDNTTDTKSSSTPPTDNPSKEAKQKPKPATSQPNIKSKPILPAPAVKSKTKDEQKPGDKDVNTKVKPPEKTVSKTKPKPTIITARTPKQLAGNKADEGKISSAENSNVTNTVEESPPSRPSFPPSANTEELNKNQSEPERPKAPPNTAKEEGKKIELKKDPKNEQSGKKRPKSKPPRPPMSKDNARVKPSRPAPAKPKVSRKSSSKLNNEKIITEKTALVKPSGPPRAQAKFDYAGGTDDDLSFKAGDTIMLSSKVDDDWLVGYLENNVMHQGMFPSSFVEIVVAMKEQPKEDKNEKASPSEPHAVALHDFQGQSEGELSFSSGQIVILLERINAEWLKGKSNNSVGIFPANFVQIEHDLPLTTAQDQMVTPAQTDNTKEISHGELWCETIHDFEGEQAEDLSFLTGAKIKIVERIGEDWFRGEHDGKCGMFPASFVQVTATSSKTSQDSFLVTAHHDYPGENRDDLSFKAGDKINVIERISSDWLMGECNGKQGLFPASFVDALHSELSPGSQPIGQENEQAKEIRMAKAIHEFTGENTGELHFSVGDVIQVLREIDSNWSEGMLNNVSGIFPTAFVEIQTAASKVQAKALYDFAGDSEHDLSFKAGDIIQLLEHVNEDWCSGSIGGKTGHFPASFVEILAS